MNEINSVTTVEALKKVKEAIKDLTHPHLGHIDDDFERETARKAYNFAIRDVTEGINFLIRSELMSLSEDQLDYIP